MWSCLPLSGDDLRAGRLCSGFSDGAQRSSLELLPRGDAEEPAASAGAFGSGGAAEDRPAPQTGRADGACHFLLHNMLS